MDSGFAEKKFLETHAEEGAGQPLVLVDLDIAVGIDGVAHDEGGSSVETGREVIDDGDTLVEKHVETQAVVPHLIAVHRQAVMLVSYYRRKCREVEQPP